MKITADTNILVRAVTEDDKRQSKVAQAEMAKAELVALSLPALSELVWVLARGYGISSVDIVTAIRGFLNAANVVADRPAVEAGLLLLEAGGDFADGVIAHEGQKLGADVFISFDKQAVRLLQARGAPAQLLS